MAKTTKIQSKKFLITAGPTWVPIDKVRVITNIFGGTLGLIIAIEAAKRGNKTTLLLGPGRVNIPEKLPKTLKIIRYKYFNELYKLMTNHLKKYKYDVVIHSAAVADYVPKRPVNKKIKSGKENLVLKLKPTIKIIDKLKKMSPNIFLVKFKVEVGVSKKRLIAIAYKSMLDSKADLMVANEFKDIISTKHKAYIIDKGKRVKEVVGKESIATNLLKVIKIKLKKC